MADRDTELLFSATQHTNDVLVSSFLHAKSFTSTGKITIEGPISAASSNGHPEAVTATSQYKFSKSGYHSYWCVLRRGQFSYYKDKQERKPLDVISADQTLDFRISDKDLRIDLYTTRRTFSLKTESLELLQQWREALQEFFVGRRRQRSQTEPTSAKANDGANAGTTSTAVFADEDEDENSDEDAAVEDDHNDDNDDDFEIISEAGPDAGFHDGSSRLFPVPEEDREFYATYSPEQDPPRELQRGILYCRVRKRLGRKTWKKVAVMLDSAKLHITSVSSKKLYRQIDLRKVVDSIEAGNQRNFTDFAIITYDERLKFRALSEQDTIDWIMNLKSCALARKNLEQLQSNSRGLDM
ncbi:LADA_0C03664g1_1 [Lachancea dasiensis]|uniref:LADA_0C03664g1_1 n=1 Tax=Lachancea dasiensis TaxID=1072105 RepID=A0A1G4IYC1_9SACH|nr:LADA_0C03664g1_1 [Lachancea dasiensis]